MSAARDCPHMEPRLYVGGLSGRVFCATQYTEHAVTVRAIVKYDVTDDFETVALELGWLPPEDVETLKAESANLVTELLRGEQNDGSGP